MKVAVLHVTRMKVTTEQYELLTVTSNVAVTKHMKGLIQWDEPAVFHNYFINSGQTWDEVKQTITEINNHNYDGLLVWMTPGANKLPIYGDAIVNYILEFVNPHPKFNLCQRDDYLSPFKKGLTRGQFGIKVPT